MKGPKKLKKRSERSFNNRKREQDRLKKLLRKALKRKRVLQAQSNTELLDKTLNQIQHLENQLRFSKSVSDDKTVTLFDHEEALPLALALAGKL